MYSYFNTCTCIFSNKGCTPSRFCTQLAQQVRIRRNRYHGVQMTYIIIQDQKAVKKTRIFTKFNISYNYGIEGYTFILISFLSRGVRSPHFAHSQPIRSELGENYCHGCISDVHHDSGPNKIKKQGKFYKIKYCIKGHILTSIHVHVSSLSRGVYAPDFAHSQPSGSGLGENQYHGCTNDVHSNSRPKSSEKKNFSQN